MLLLLMYFEPSPIVYNHRLMNYKKNDLRHKQDLRMHARDNHVMKINIYQSGWSSCLCYEDKYLPVWMIELSMETLMECWMWMPSVLGLWPGALILRLVAEINVDLSNEMCTFGLSSKVKPLICTLLECAMTKA